jgi:hypothetical protein
MRRLVKGWCSMYRGVVFLLLAAMLALIVAAPVALAGGGGHHPPPPPPKLKCPDGTPVTLPPNPKKMAVCHGTGSATNPYVLIWVSDNAQGHLKHAAEGRDVIFDND